MTAGSACAQRLEHPHQRLKRAAIVDFDAGVAEVDDAASADGRRGGGDEFNEFRALGVAPGADAFLDGNPPSVQRAGVDAVLAESVRRTAS